MSSPCPEPGPEAPSSAPAAAAPGVGESRRPGRWSSFALLPVDLLIFLGAFALVYGAYGWSDPLAAAVGALLLVGALGLFLYEGRWTRAGIHPGAVLFPWQSAAVPYWKRRISFTGRWLCPACGWREEAPATLCPRCGKVLVRLPPPAADVKS